MKTIRTCTTLLNQLNNHEISGSEYVKIVHRNFRIQPVEQHWKKNIIPAMSDVYDIIKPKVKEIEAALDKMHAIVVPDVYASVSRESLDMANIIRDSREIINEDMVAFEKLFKEQTELLRLEQELIKEILKEHAELRNNRHVFNVEMDRSTTALSEMGKDELAEVDRQHKAVIDQFIVVKVLLRKYLRLNYYPQSELLLSKVELIVNTITDDNIFSVFDKIIEEEA